MVLTRSPKIIIVISGKRKSGKDYVANLLQIRLNSERSGIICLSGPLKKRYALENNLDYEKLLDASAYKEVHRAKMITWGEEIRNKDPGYFCRHAIEQSNAKYKQVWIVSDARRKSDVQFFLDNYPTKTCTIRVTASDSVRQKRGWEFMRGVDDCESECGLDDYCGWRFHITNDDDNQLNESLDQVFSFVASKL